MTRFLSGLAAALILVGGGAGCTEAPASGPVGYLDIPLTAPGAGGAVYRLPPTTALSVFGSMFSGFFPIDDDAPSKTVQVPPGNYSVSLSDAGGDTTVWPLTRENADGTTEVVQAMLDLPGTISVTENETTPLVIRFHVATLGPITFSHGSVAISVEVDETTATSFEITLGSPTLSVTGVAVADDAPAALAPRLPANGGTGDGYSVTAHTTGPWVALSNNLVCAPVTASVTASGNQGFIQLTAEAPPSGSDQLCIEQASPQLAFVFISFFRAGGATTALLSDLGDQQDFVSHGIDAEISADLFEDFTLHLDALSGSHAASIAVFGSITAELDSPDGTRFDGWYSLSEFGDGTIGVTGH